MKLTVYNLGVVHKAELEMGNLTIISGVNSSGKSLLISSLWKILTKSHNIQENYQSDILIEKFQTYLKYVDMDIGSKFNFTQNKLIKLTKAEYNDIINDLLNIIKDNLILSKSDMETLFHVNGSDKIFDKCMVNLFIDTNIINHAKISQYISIEDYSINMEKLLNGCVLNKCNINELVSYLINRLLNDLEHHIKAQLLFKDIHLAPTALTTLDLEDVSIITKHNSFIAKKHHYIIESLERIMGGCLEYHHAKGIYLNLSSNTENKLIPYELLSASIRRLSYIYFYIKHKVTKDSLFIIEEPEVYLHPENQKRISHIVVMLMNVGVNILITTHSDFILREINNLIALKRMDDLHHPIDHKIYKKYKDCLPNLQNKKISINYMINTNQKYELCKAEIRNNGAEVESFNNTINEQIEVMEYIASHFEEIEDEY